MSAPECKGAATVDDCLDTLPAIWSRAFSTFFGSKLTPFPKTAFHASEMIVIDVNRVTRLGEFSPIGRLLLGGSFLENKKVTLIFGIRFTR
jgi:hypothetical protein